MGQRRRRYWRKPDMRRNRKREPPPTTGWLKKELIQLVPVAASTITTYIRKRLLPAPVFRGTATRYQRNHLVMLLAIRILRSNGVTELASIKQRMDRLTAYELELWVKSQPIPKAAALALGASQTTSSVAAAPPPPANTNGSGSAAAPLTNAAGVQSGAVSAVAPPSTSTTVHSPQSPPAESGELALLPATWQHVELAPGVVVMWRTDAPIESKTVVQRLLLDAAQRRS